MSKEDLLKLGPKEEQQKLKPSPKIYGYVLLMLPFIAAGFYMLSSNDPIYFVGGIICITFFGFATLLFLYKSQKATLIVSKKGFYPSYFIPSIRKFVPWGDVLHINLVEQKVHFLIIYFRQCHCAVGA